MSKELEAITHWETVTIKLPPRVRALLEDELERIRNLAGIDPDNNLPDQVRDGLALEYIVILSAQTPDESVV